MHQFESKHELCQWLNQFSHPMLGERWSEASGVVRILATGQVNICLPFVAQGLPDTLGQWLNAQIAERRVPEFDYQLVTEVAAMETGQVKPVSGVKNILAVTSAKGGVGKSTTAVNLALALHALGAKVGILDADIYGPSVPLMLGTQGKAPEVTDNKWMKPVEAHGLYTNSIGYLVSKDEAAIWRGPMASKALSQLLNETRWPELDYLVVDMPPGTGDIQLTLAQQIPVSSALIVTTPQDLALADARKGAAMLEKVDVPVAGLVENMSYHICSQCGHEEAIFGAGGAEKMAQEYGLALLAKMPLHISVREDIDAGLPTVAARLESEHASLYLELASKVASRTYHNGKVRPQTISVMMTD